jgi:hypothetical protein
VAIDQVAPRSARRKAEAQVGHVGRLAVGMEAGGFHVVALDEPDVHAGLGQRVGVGR